MVDKWQNDFDEYVNLLVEEFELTGPEAEELTSSIIG